MTNVRAWAWSAVALVALIAAALLTTGAVSFAQDGSTTATPAPSATTAPTDSTGGTATPAPHSSDDPNCPNMGTDSSGRSSSSTSRYNMRSVTSSAPGA